MAGPDPELASGPAQPVRVAALYQFTRFPDVESLKGPLLALCKEQGIRGTLLLAREGVNGTIAGGDAGIDAVLAHLRALPGCAGLDVMNRAAALPFDRMKVRLKREIVTMGEPDIDPLATGHYVAPEEWNALIDAPDTIVIDTRNAYEVALGTFKGAIDPETRSFREFPEWFRQFRKDREAAQGPMPRVAMFCTGGIRCEKSTAFLKAEGIDEVYHLKGGILAYLEQVPQEQSRWQGECFVFDQRVTVDRALQPGNRALCKRCQGLIASEDGPRPACDHLGFRDQA